MKDISAPINGNTLSALFFNLRAVLQICLGPSAILGEKPYAGQSLSSRRHAGVEAGERVWVTCWDSQA
jgi:hypothetical protein